MLDMSNGIWSEFRRLLAEDIKKLGVEKFRDFGVVHQTMRASYFDFTKDRLDKETEELLRNSVTDEEDFYNLVNQVCHIRHFLDMSKVVISDLGAVFEFGGGCGYMCQAMQLLGFKGEYNIYDFPEVQEIQKYYLGSVGKVDNVKFISSPSNREVDLFIGCWSVSESTPRLPMSTFPAKEYWIAYQRDFDGVDNEQFFSSSFRSSQTVVTKHSEQSKYLVGSL